MWQLVNVLAQQKEAGIQVDESIQRSDRFEKWVEVGKSGSSNVFNTLMNLQVGGIWIAVLVMAVLVVGIVREVGNISATGS